MLPRANPDVVDPAGAPRFGAYAGSVETVDWSGLGRAPGCLYRLLHHKKWWYVAVATDQLLAAFAIVDLGYASTGFAYVADLPARRLLTRRSLIGLPMQVAVGPQPAGGAYARLRVPGAELLLERESAPAPYRLEVRAGSSLHGELELDPTGSTALTAICSVEGGGLVTCTQKLAALPARGVLTVAGRRFLLDGGLGGLDYTNGLLARETAWRWAFGFARSADGGRLGWNLVEGWNRDENAAWVDGVPQAVRAPRFGFDPRDTAAPWHIRAEDGALDLRFEPAASFNARHNLVVARSRFVQPAGRFSGRVLGQEVAAAPGVTEDQCVLW